MSPSSSARATGRPAIITPWIFPSSSTTDAQTTPPRGASLCRCQTPMYRLASRCVMGRRRRRVVNSARRPARPSLQAWVGPRRRCRRRRPPNRGVGSFRQGRASVRPTSSQSRRGSRNTQSRLRPNRWPPPSAGMPRRTAQHAALVVPGPRPLLHPARPAQALEGRGTSRAPAPEAAVLLPEGAPSVEDLAPGRAPAAEAEPERRAALQAVTRGQSSAAWASRASASFT